MVGKNLAIIGAGVRGTAALGRIAARLRHSSEQNITIHVIDPFPAGSGAIWRTDQPSSLVMNTVAAQSTVFDDESLGFVASLPGPNFAEWCELVASGEITGEPTWALDLARETLPWSSPSRALYGRYLQWAFQFFVDSLPETTRLVFHQDRAVSLARSEKQFLITLHAGEELIVDGVLLSIGWLPRPGAVGTHIRGGSPIDQGLESLRAGERVAVRGIGMGFIDLLSIVTEDRGGVFTPDPMSSRPGALRYTTSGAEPRIIAGSRNGLPFLAKPAFGAVPPAVRFEALQAALPRLESLESIDFNTQVRPLIDHAAAWEHYRALAEHRPDAFLTDAGELLQVFAATAVSGQELDAWRAAAVAAVPDPALRYDPERVATPVGGTSLEEINAAIALRLERDADEAALGFRSAHKRGLHVFQAARAAIIPLTEFGRVSEASLPGMRSYLALANLIGSGPPLFRAEQLIALHDAGIVRFFGPGFSVAAGDTGYQVSGIRAPEEIETVDRVVDAFLDLPDASRLADPLLNSLLESGLARIWRRDSERPTIEITPESSALVDATGRASHGIYSVGPLHEELRRFTIIAPIPNARSTVLREIDAAVEALLRQNLLPGDETTPNPEYQEETA